MLFLALVLLGELGTSTVLRGEDGIGASVKWGVIFSDKYTTQAVAEYPIIGITGPYWTPEAEHIVKLEKKLATFLRSSKLPKGDKLASKLAEYKRQYMGFTDSKRRTILVEAFCKDYWERNPSWQSKIVLVLGGGHCFFRIRYDVASDTFYGLEVNSER